MAKQPACRSGGCRVCLKSFKDGDYSRVCSGCKFKVCEDCATSYTKIGEDEVNAHYSCIYNSVHNRVYLRNCTYGQGRKKWSQIFIPKTSGGQGELVRGNPSIAKQSVPIYYAVNLEPPTSLSDCFPSCTVFFFKTYNNKSVKIPVTSKVWKREYRNVRSING